MQGDSADFGGYHMKAGTDQFLEDPGKQLHLRKHLLRGIGFLIVPRGDE